MLDQATTARFETALASGKLKELAQQMAFEGLSQVAIYHLFDNFHEFLNEQKREADWEILYQCLECIVGYCAPGAKWFPEYLTNEQVEAYRNSVSQPANCSEPGEVVSISC